MGRGGELLRGKKMRGHGKLAGSKESFFFF